jgi:opacity protein-like surface antigen
MNRGLWTSIICLAILLSTTLSAFAESSDGPQRRPREYPSRDRSYRTGFEGRTMLRVHAGFSVPTGDFSTAVNTGLGLGASIGYGVGRSTVLSWGVAYHRFGEQGVDGHVGVVPITMAVDYGFSTSARVRPWISGGLGLYHLNETVVGISDSENDFGFNLGAGIAMPTSGRSTFGAGFKFHHIVGNAFPDTDFLALQAGLSFPL